MRPLPAQLTQERSGLARAQLHAARNSLYAVQVATYSLAEFGPDLSLDDRQRLRQSIEGEIEHLRELLRL